MTNAPGTAVKELFGVVERNNCAVMVTVDPTKLSPAVVLKYAASEVIVPVRDAEKAKLSNVPAAPVRSIIPPLTLTPVALLPKPTKLEVFRRPPNTVVNATGSPDA